MKIYQLKWGQGGRRIASFARLETLVTHFRENVKSHPEHRRWKNPILRVKGKDEEAVRLSEGEVRLLIDAGLMKQVERIA